MAGGMVDGDSLALPADARRLAEAAERAEREAGEWVSLYRAVGERELADILRRDGFRPDPRDGSRSVKFFALSAADATRFGKRTYTANGRPFAVVEARVPRAVAERLRRGVAYDLAYAAVPPAALTAFNAAAEIRVLPWPRRR